MGEKARPGGNRGRGCAGKVAEPGTGGERESGWAGKVEESVAGVGIEYVR